MGHHKMSLCSTLWICVSTVVTTECHITGTVLGTTVVTGQDVTLTCVSTTSYDICWDVFRGESLYSETVTAGCQINTKFVNTYTVSCGLGGQRSNSSLTIHSVTEDQSGRYRCSECPTTQEAFINLTVLGKPTNVIITPSSQSEFKDADVLRCSSEGSITPNYTWVNTTNYTTPIHIGPTLTLDISHEDRIEEACTGRSTWTVQCIATVVNEHGTVEIPSASFSFNASYIVTCDNVQAIAAAVTEPIIIISAPVAACSVAALIIIILTIVVSQAKKRKRETTDQRDEQRTEEKQYERLDVSTRSTHGRYNDVVLTT